MALRQQFGDLDAARAALTQLAHALEDLDDPEATPSETEQPSATRNDPPTTRRSKT